MNTSSSSPGPSGTLQRGALQLGALRRGFASLWTAAGGALVGGIWGAVTASELSTATPAAPGALVGAVGGAVFGRVTAPLLRDGTSRDHPAAGRRAPTTILAAVAALTTAVLAMAIWLRVRNGLGPAAELEALAVDVIGVVLLAPTAIVGAVAIGLLRRRALARWVAVLVYSGVTIGALSAVVAADSHRAEPASLLTAAMTVLVLLLSAPTRRDFRSAGSAAATADLRRRSAAEDTAGRGVGRGGVG